MVQEHLDTLNQRIKDPIARELRDTLVRESIGQ